MFGPGRSRASDIGRFLEPYRSSPLIAGAVYLWVSVIIVDAFDTFGAAYIATLPEQIQLNLVLFVTVFGLFGVTTFVTRTVRYVRRRDWEVLQ